MKLTASSLNVNILLGRHVKNLSHNKYKFINAKMSPRPANIKRPIPVPTKTLRRKTKHAKLSRLV